MVLYQTERHVPTQIVAQCAKTTPSTLPNAAGIELPVDRLLVTVSEYERLMAHCNATLQVSPCQLSRRSATDLLLSWRNAL